MVNHYQRGTIDGSYPFRLQVDDFRQHLAQMEHFFQRAAVQIAAERMVQDLEELSKSRQSYRFRFAPNIRRIGRRRSRLCAAVLLALFTVLPRHS